MAISIETTQNVTIDYEIASIGERVVAAIVDVFIIVGYVVGVGLLFDALGLDFITAIWVLFYLPVFAYDLLCELFLDGQSFGKKAMKIRVVRVDGSEPTIGAYLLRWILRPVDYFFMLGLLVLAINGRGQRLGDLAAGTTVIRLRPRIALDDALLPELSEHYTPTFPEVTRLSDRDMAIIRDVWSAGRSQQTRATIDALAARVAAVMGIEDPRRRAGISGADAFLETVVRDYTFFTQGEPTGAERRR